MINKIGYFLLFLCFSFSSFAQQLPVFTQYRSNIGLINPAGLNADYLLYEYPTSIGISARTQWAATKDAPQTQVLRGDYVFGDSRGAGLLIGGYLLNDKVGYSSFSNLNARMAVILTDDPYYGGVSLGLTFGLAQFRLRASQVKLTDSNDVLGSVDQATLYPDVGVGIFAYKRLNNDDNLYAGLSVPQVLGLDLTLKSDDGDFQLKREPHFYAIAGIYHFINDFSFIEPSVWVKYLPGVPLNIDLNIRYQMSKDFWIGVGGASSKTLHGEAGVILGENIGWDGALQIGYGYDYAFSSFGPFFGNSHEINISIALGGY